MLELRLGLPAAFVGLLVVARWWESRIRRQGREWRDRVNRLPMTHPLRLYPHGPQVMYGAVAVAMGSRLLDRSDIANGTAAFASLFALSMLAAGVIWERVSRGSR